MRTPPHVQTLDNCDRSPSVLMSTIASHDGIVQAPYVSEMAAAFAINLRLTRPRNNGLHLQTNAREGTGILFLVWTIGASQRRSARKLGQAVRSTPGRPSGDGNAGGTSDNMPSPDKATDLLRPVSETAGGIQRPPDRLRRCAVSKRYGSSSPPLSDRYLVRWPAQSAWIVVTR